jgi:DNA ligase-1
LSLEEAWPEVETLLEKLSSRELTGNAARDAVALLLSKLHEEEAQVLENILKGDLRCGINVGLINKIFPGTIPEYPYMRCSLIKGSNIEKFDWENGVFSQEKADGMFANVFFYPDGKVKITSRNGTVFPNSEFKTFIMEFTKVAEPGFCYNGELLVSEKQSTENWKVLPREIGNGILNSVLKNGSFKDNQKPFYLMWDKIPLENAVPGGKYEVPYKERYKEIQKIKGQFFLPIPTKKVFSLKEAFEHYTQMTSIGCEGTVIKDPRAIWEDGTSKDQVKMKIEAEVDLIVRGFNPGNGKNEKWFGSLICESSDGLVRTNVSGFSDSDRERITKEMDDWIDKKIITVRANSLMPNENGQRRLFLPRFVEERLDKTEADSLEKIIQIFNEAMLGKY